MIAAEGGMTDRRGPSDEGVSDREEEAGGPSRCRIQRNTQDHDKGPVMYMGLSQTADENT